MKFFDIYVNLLLFRLDSLKYIFVLVELIFFFFIVKCVRWFLVMDRIKINFKIRIEKRILLDLLRIKGMDFEMKDFDFNLVIEVWFFGAKIKKYVMKRGNDVLVVVFIDGLFVSGFF